MKTNSNKQIFSVEEKLNHIVALQASNQGLSNYCRQHNLSTSTMSTWMTKFKKDNHFFKQVNVIPEMQKVDNRPLLTVIVRGTLKLSFNDLSDIEAISKLLRDLK